MAGSKRAKAKANAGLSVFKGRGARLTHAILSALVNRGPQTIYDIYKEIKTKKGLGHTRYANVNMRVRSLVQSGYIEKTGQKTTKAGFQAIIYEITNKALLAMLLNSVDIENLLSQINEENAQTIIGDILNVM